MSARLKLFILFVACAAPFVLGWAAWYFKWGIGAPGNYGELLPPRPIAGTPFEALRGKWVLVNFDRAACNAYCEKKLYFMRQVRTAQGKDQGRVERLWIVTDDGRPRPELLAAIEGTRISRAKPDGFPGEPVDHIYLVDPLGNLMMRFPRDPDPSKMLKDLQRLLKYSQLG
ncbi:MAG TPA: cytochrome C oxidase subunit I [Burkholderiales bacterium]|nr:cytochrome C oxidase subunit I [Burkholderiales bacterium]